MFASCSGPTGSNSLKMKIIIYCIFKSIQEQWRGSKLQHKNYCFQFCTPPSCHCRVFPTHLIRITFVLLLSYEKGRAMNQQSTSIVTIATQIRKRARSPPTRTYPVLRTVVLFSIYLTPINFLLLIFAQGCAEIVPCGSLSLLQTKGYGVSPTDIT